MAAVSRRNFLQVAGVAGAAGMLAACDTKPAEEPGGEGSGSEPTPSEPEPVEPEEPTGPAAIIHDASEYPIDPDGDDVEALWTSEQMYDKWYKVTAEGAPELGIWDESKIIQVDGLAFKDLNGNGKLDLYEDWRQTHDDRSAALAEMMSADQAMLLMWHGGDESMSGSVTDEEGNVLSHGNCRLGSRAGVSRLSTTLDTYASDIEWINEVQMVCEDSEFGIPYLNSTDPYYVFDMPAYCSIAATMDKDMWRKAGMWLGRAWRASGIRCLLGPQIDVYSQPLGCRLSGSVSEDPALNRDFVQAFCAGMQSTWGDDDASEDLGWGKDSCAAMLKHYVGEGSVEGGRNDHSFPGEFNVFPGDNFEAHLIPFLDGGLNLDSVTGRMSAVMPCYGMAYDEDEKYGENVGSGYSKRNLGILRNAGWDGMLCTDWGIILDNGADYGVEDLTQPERYAKMIEAGIDQYGGGFFIENNEPAFEILKEHLGEDEALARVRDSARRITKLMMDVDLFENPYSDRNACKELLKSETAAAFGLELSEKSVVMLKNHDNVIHENCIEGKPKAYIPQTYFSAGFFSTVPSHFELSIDETIANELFEVVTDEVPETESPAATDVVRADADKLKDCEYAIIRIANPTCSDRGISSASNMFGTIERGAEFEYVPITLQYRPYTADTARDPSLAGEIVDGVKENRTYKGKTSVCDNEADLDLVIATREALPDDAKLIVLIEASNPMCFHEIEPYCDVIFYCVYETMTPAPAAYANLVSGKTEPSALLNYQMPANMETVEAQFEDVPRDMECYVDEDGNTYDFAFGLNWSGQIKDERYERYSAAPLTKCETEVIPGE